MYDRHWNIFSENGVYCEGNKTIFFQLGTNNKNAHNQKDNTMITRNLIRIFAIVFFISIFALVSANATTCGVMSIVSIASSDSGNGGQIWLKNETSTACGNVAAGANYLFNLPSTNTDKTLAVLLTAMSLDKNLWVAFDDSTDPGVLQIVAVQK